MEKVEMLEQIASLLENVTRMVSVLAIGQRLTMAESEEERVYLSRALSMLLQREPINIDTHSEGMHYSNEQQFYR